MGAEVICMTKDQKNPNAGTNVQKVKKQNQQSKQAEPGQYGTEFAEETDAQYVKKQNRKSQQKKSQQSYHVQENTLSLRRVFLLQLIKFGDKSDKRIELWLFESNCYDKSDIEVLSSL